MNQYLNQTDRWRAGRLFVVQLSSCFYLTHARDFCFGWKHAQMYGLSVASSITRHMTVMRGQGGRRP